ncbi:uncharacterized protein BX664DRAFT_316057 [Halteromyces radiatus]|uniref:uncharacterized protein n=1 Tax=Halteromyces radiatus TaxID=101107 RepID=UPI0022206722|nr:uncharacterized protein BX664DRAFT_316057 [Halteromyces radiatus]KAI8084504.1 hypothetical protein BX664DRAFT_316057 [Halteromyces radiatus]
MRDTSCNSRILEPELCILTQKRVDTKSINVHIDVDIGAGVPMAVGAETMSFSCKISLISKGKLADKKKSDTVSLDTYFKKDHTCSSDSTFIVDIVFVQEREEEEANEE